MLQFDFLVLFDFVLLPSKDKDKEISCFDLVEDMTSSAALILSSLSFTFSSDNNFSSFVLANLLGCLSHKRASFENNWMA